MFREYLVRIWLDGMSSSDVVIVAVNALVARDKAFELYGCHRATVLRDMTGCEYCHA